MASNMCCGLYRGTFYIKDLSNSSNPLLPVGNAEANITQEMTEITQTNFQSLGGSNCKVEYTESVNLELTLHCTSPENLAIAFLGSVTKLTGTAVVDEAHTVHAKGELIPTNFVPDKSVAVVVDGAGGTPTYVAGTDYVQTNAGIVILESGSIAPGPILISYTYGSNYKVDAQTTAQKEFMVVLDGYNVGEGEEKAVVLKAWKVKFAPTDSFSLISGEEFSSLVLNGEILRDNTKTSGSKFFTVEFEV